MNSMQFFTNQFGDRYLHEVNRSTFVRLGAEAQFRRHYGKALQTPDSLHIIIGTDSGLLVRHIQQLQPPEGSKYLFIELPELLPPIRDALSDLELGDNIVLTTPDHWQAQLEALNFDDYANLDAVLIYESLGAADAFIEAYRSLMSTIKQQLDAVLWSYKIRLGHPLFVRRQLENLIESHIPAIQLKDLFPGKTAVILGGGPSLDAVLPWLAERQDELLILAVSRVCRRLQQVGIRPHIVVTIDPTQMSFDISRELLTLDPEVILARANHAVFRLVGQWPGRSVYLDQRLPWRRKDEPENLGAAGPTVTNTALQLALAMGVQQIILAGVDLCHDRQGHTHAAGSNEREQGPRPPAVDIEVETNGGYMATTTPDFFNAIRAMERQAEAAGRLGVRLINPAPGAARMRHIEHLPLEAIEYSPLHRPLEQLHQALSGDDPAARRAHLREMQQALAHANGRLRGIIRLTEEALECNAHLFGRLGRPADFKYKKRMDRIERKLDRDYKDLSVIVRLFSARELLRMPPSDREWTDEEIEQAGNTYYTAYRKNARQVLELIEAAQQRLEAALMEVSDSPDIGRLADQWERDGIPGRARVWRRRHPEAAARLDTAQQAVLERLDQAFQAQLREDDTEHRRMLARTFTLDGVRARLQVLFKRRDSAELERLARQLEQYDSSQAAELRLLARAYAAELEGDIDGAFAIYGQLIALNEQQPPEDGSLSPQLEDALCRMAGIALDNEQGEQALLILETLTGFSPIYAPQLAELLRITGHWQKAAEIYSDYLALAPDDLSAMLRLGKLYQEHGAAEAAHAAFEYILDRDPSNSDVQTLMEQTRTGTTA